MHEARLCLTDSRMVRDDTLATFHGWLGPSELQRHAQFVRRARQRQFLLGRGLLRQMLGELLGIECEAVRLLERHGQAPLLDLPEYSDVGFSLSHSGPWVACTVSSSSALGLDIEMLDASRDLAALAAQAFDADENAWFNARPESGQVRDFYALWSAKEALFKLGGPSAKCLQFEHPELSIALCSAQPLVPAPALTIRLF
jgi:4'-phosphopantetheinyl transferase